MFERLSRNVTKQARKNALDRRIGDCCDELISLMLDMGLNPKAIKGIEGLFPPTWGFSQYGVAPLVAN